MTTKQHPYWLPLVLSETTELYCEDCGKRILAERLATGQILWEYICLDDPERDLIDLQLSTEYGVPIEVEFEEDGLCEECDVPLNVEVMVAA